MLASGPKDFEDLLDLLKSSFASHCVKVQNYLSPPSPVMNLIFLMRYVLKFILIKGLQQYQWSDLEVEINFPGQPGPERGSVESGRVDDFFRPPTLTFNIFAAS